MKNSTKLHFYSLKANGEYDTSNIFEDFFLGGKIPAAKTGNEIEYFYPKKNAEGTYIGKVTAEDRAFIMPQYDNQNNLLGGIIKPIFDRQSLKQNLECRCSIILKELPYNIRLGIPLKLSLEDKQISVMSIINGTPGVLHAEVIGRSIKNRKYTIQVNIHSTFGTFTMSVS